MDFFDIPNLLGRAASGQGFINPGEGSTGNPLAAAFSSSQTTDLRSEEEKRRSRRAMGNVGAF
jgi:hypothetical protein